MYKKLSSNLFKFNEEYVTLEEDRLACSCANWQWGGQECIHIVSVLIDRKMIKETPTEELNESEPLLSKPGISKIDRTPSQRERENDLPTRKKNPNKSNHCAAQLKRHAAITNCTDAAKTNFTEVFSRGRKIIRKFDVKNM